MTRTTRRSSTRRRSPKKDTAKPIVSEDAVPSGVTDAPPTTPTPPAPPAASPAPPPVTDAPPADAPPPPVPEAPTDGPVALTDEEWDAFVAENAGAADLPLHPEEEITAQRLHDDGDLVVVTSFGRKVGISPDGWMAVLTGPGLLDDVRAVPKPPRKSWKDPR